MRRKDANLALFSRLKYEVEGLRNPDTLEVIETCHNGLVRVSTQFSQCGSDKAKSLLVPSIFRFIDKSRRRTTKDENAIGIDIVVVVRA